MVLLVSLTTDVQRRSFSCARETFRIDPQAQRHCDRADKVFSDVVDCCGGGLSSVERILAGTKTIADDDGTETFAQLV